MAVAAVAAAVAAAGIAGDLSDDPHIGILVTRGSTIMIPMRPPSGQSLLRSHAHPRPPRKNKMIRTVVSMTAWTQAADLIMGTIR